MADSKTTAFRPTAAVLGCLIAAGCGNTDGPTDPGSLSEGTAFLVVTMQQSSGAGLVSSVATEVAEEAASIDLGNVASLTVQVTRIEFLPATADENEENEAQWISLQLDESVILDLVSLPVEAESPLVLAAGDVPLGDYRQVRFLVGAASILFNDAFAVGQATFEGEHVVTIPSGEQTGLKTDLVFTVTDDGDAQQINLLFDPDATFQNATATGSGKVIVAPVIR